MIDTVNAYQNERACGRAIKRSGLKREDIYLSTKLWPSMYADAPLEYPERSDCSP